MSIRNLVSLFDPGSIAVFGASMRDRSIGATVWRNLSSGAYQGKLYAVNPKYRMLGEHPVVPHAADLPTAPSLAVICTPANTVAAVVKEVARLGTRAAVVLSTGLDHHHKQDMLLAAQRHLLRILGPDTMGLLVPHIGLNASLAHIDALAGDLAFVSQSGALVTTMLDWARARGIGFSHFVSLGDGADIDIGDMLDFLASDAKTRAILLYAESIDAPAKFMSAARAAARNKPVIMVKAGRSPRGQRAALTHTGALAGSDLVFDAAIARAGMLRVDTLQELFLAAQTLSRFRSNTAETLAIMANGGGAGVMAADAAARAGVELSEFASATKEQLAAILPNAGAPGNPIDVGWDAPAARYQAALKILLDDPTTGAILLIHAPTAMASSGDIAAALAPLTKHDHSLPPRVLSCWLGDRTVEQARQIFQDAGVPNFDTPEQAVQAFSMLLRHRRNQTELSQAPPAVLAQRPPDSELIKVLVQAAMAAGRDRLSESEVQAVLKACHIPTAAAKHVPAKAQAAADAAMSLGFPVALKIHSDASEHKSELGGVALNLQDETSVREAATAMLERLLHARPGARVRGFTLQAMVTKSQAHELIVGSTVDGIFGPVILFGQGGTSAEITADRAVGLPPLNMALAKVLVSRTRIGRLLDAQEEASSVACESLTSVLVAVSQLLAEIPEISEIDINPLILNVEGVVALDARIHLNASAPAGAKNFVIRPYPVELEELVPWCGQTLVLRPIRPEDEALHVAFLQGLSPEDIRMRVFYSKRGMERSELARLVQIDYAREMAFVALADGPDGRPQTVGVVRALSDPDNVEAEFGVIVGSAHKGGGLGLLLMKKMIAYLRSQGTQRLVATVLDENERMLRLARALGFVENKGASRGSGTREIVLALTSSQ